MPNIEPDPTRPVARSPEVGRPVSDATDIVQVAVGVLTDQAGRVLITRRSETVHQGGLWEFPGGKVEPGESTQDALIRELAEELGVTVHDSRQEMVIRHDYGDKHVLLDIHRVTRWAGEPRGLEGQPLAWIMPDALGEFEFPAANAAIVERLQQ